ncbi:MAG TPA: hypothetical protein DD412_00185 [Holosporales bacterium]|nr:hypothetical protein [Holosporales bacterium]
MINSFKQIGFGLRKGASLAALALSVLYAITSFSLKLFSVILTYYPALISFILFMISLVCIKFFVPFTKGRLQRRLIVVGTFCFIFGLLGLGSTYAYVVRNERLAAAAKKKETELIERVKKAEEDKARGGALKALFPTIFKL